MVLGSSIQAPAVEFGGGGDRLQQISRINCPRFTVMFGGLEVTTSNEPISARRRASLRQKARRGALGAGDIGIP